MILWKGFINYRYVQKACKRKLEWENSSNQLVEQAPPIARTHFDYKKMSEYKKKLFINENPQLIKIN